MGRTKKTTAESQTTPVGPEAATIRIVVQCSPTWAKWLKKGAKFCKTDVSKLLDISVTDYLEAKGFPEKAPDRVPEAEED